jgi:CRP/FNR family transcriptional regulator, cyclic AMP receptor protein
LCVSLAPGPWEPPIERVQPGGLGVLVVEGLLVRDVVLAGTRCTELIGTGDIVEPNDLWAGDRLVPLGIDWTILEDTRVALLDARFAALASRWPPLLSAMFARVAERSFRLSTHAAICQLGRVELRLLALMWHLAERWGRVSPEGITLPLRFSHATLGRLVGARRPTVSLALKELASRGDIVRRADGTWCLRGEAPAELGLTAPEAPTSRLPMLVAPEAVVDGGPPRPSPDGRRELLLERVQIAREMCRTQAADTLALTERTQAVRDRSLQLREGLVAERRLRVRTARRVRRRRPSAGSRR